MRCLKKNKQKLYYSLLIGTSVEYELDANGNKIVEYTDGQTTYYRETGDGIPLYSAPAEFEGNIAMSGSDIARVEFGIDEAHYEAVLVLKKGTVPLTETSLIWYQTTPVTKTIDEKTYADESSADYRILKVSPSLNNDVYILGKVVK